MRTMHSMRTAWGVIIALAIMTLIPLSALAQAGYGSIAGAIQDPAGAVVPNAKVAVTNTATNVATHSTSLGDGRYLAAQLPPGIYQVSVEAAGFKKYVASGIVVQVEDKLTVDVNLVLGSTTETMTITTEAPPLRTEDAQTGEVVNNDFIMNLPEIDRNPFDLLRISGEVQGAEGGVSSNTRINGGRTSSMDFFIDGSVVTSGRGHSLTNQTPSMDSVQEFKVVTNGISAEYGHLSGGYVELVTKSGTNAYHGTLYEYMYNDMFDANSWYQNAIGNPKVHFRQNDYGFTLGGPVRIPKIYNGKNKTFFFVDNEYLKYSQGGSLVLMSVPTQDERNGNMTQTLANGIPTMMYDPNGPQSATPDSTGAYTRLALLGGDGKTVPAAQIDPTSAAILADLPMPNRPTVAGFSSENNYGAPQATLGNNFRLGVRLDQVITENQRIAIHYTTASSDFGTTRVGGPLMTATTNDSDGGRNGNVNYDWTARPTLLFNLRASVIHTPGLTGAALPSGFNSSSIKFPAAFQSILGTGTIPQIWSIFESGYQNYAEPPTDSVTVTTTYDFAFTGTKILNRHTLKFGVENRRYYDNFASTGGGIIWFDSNPVQHTTGDHGGGTDPQNALGAYLLGINDWNSVTGPTTRAMNINYNAAFVQDDFKVTPKLTVNVGLRWDREGPTSERHDKIYFWDQNTPSLFTVNSGYSWTGALAAAGLPTSIPAPSWVTNGMPNGAIELPNTPDFPSRSFQNVNSHQFAPRLGIAYKLDNKTVLRASGNLMYIPTTGDANGFATANESLPLGNAGNAGWHTSVDGERHFISTWQNPFPLPTMVTNYTRDTLQANQQSSLGPGVGVFNQNMHMPREYTWMVGAERQLGAGFVLEGNYSGNRGIGLLAPNLVSHYPASLFTPAYGPYMDTQVTSPNAGQTQTNTITGPTQPLGILEFPYPQYGPVNVLGSNLGASTYHSLNVRLEHRMSHGLMFLLNYTYSHLLDDVGGPEADTTGGTNVTGAGGKMPQSIATFQSTWGLSANDQPHRLILTYVYQLPFGKGRQWLGHPQGVGQKILDNVAGGWQFSGNSVWVSGTPVVLWSSNTININNDIEVEDIYGSYASSNHNLSNPNFTGNNQVLVSPETPITSATVGRFNNSAIIGAQRFVSGNLPPVSSDIRNPPFYQTDLSIMKNFYLGAEQKRYLQIRGEGQNAFNIRGFGAYNNEFGLPTFGLIQGAGNSPRSIQLSARIIF